MDTAILLAELIKGLTNKYLLSIDRLSLQLWSPADIAVQIIFRPIVKSSKTFWMRFIIELFW